MFNGHPGHPDHVGHSDHVGDWPFRSAADRYGVSIYVVKKLADRLQIGYKSGGHWFFTEKDLRVLEIGVRAMGYRILPPVAESDGVTVDAENPTVMDAEDPIVMAGEDEPV
jgi:hypothetical protein